MKPIRFASLGLLALLPATALAAPSSTMSRHAVLHVPAALQHNMHFAHVMGSATLTQKGMDWSVKVSAENLPMASTLKANRYVVWITSGSKRATLGTLKVHGMMAGLTAMTMWHSVQGITVTAEKSRTVSRPSGTVVLSGMVG